MRKKLTLIIDAVIVLALIGAGVWWYSSKGAGRTISVVKTPAVQETALTEKTPEPVKEEFVVSMFTATSTYGNEKITTDEPEKLPESVQFQSFSYDPTQGKIIAVSG